MDLIIFCQSIFKNPYRILRRFKNSNPVADPGDVYGETPLRLLKIFTKKFGLTSDDVFYDLGSGLGRVSFWVHHFARCKKVIGIERIPQFVRLATQLQRYFFFNRLSFVEGDFTTDFSLEEATFIYFYGTSYSSEVIYTAGTKLQSLRKGAVVVTVSFPLTDFIEGFSSTEVLFGRFPWGKTAIFKNVKQ